MRALLGRSNSSRSRSRSKNTSSPFMRGSRFSGSFKGGSGRGVRGRAASPLAHDKGYYHSCLGRSRKPAFGHTRRLEPQPSGAVTRRAVAQRGSRAGGLTRLSAEAIRGFSPWALLPIRLPDEQTPRQHPEIRRKSFVFSSLPIRKVLVLPFAGGVSPPLPVVSLLFSVSYPQS